MTSVTDFLTNGSPPPQVTTYGSTTVGIPDWLSGASWGLTNTAAGVAQGLSQSGYPLAGLPQIGRFNPNYGTAQGLVNDANAGVPMNFYKAAQSTEGIMNGGQNPLAAAQGYFDQAGGGYASGLGADSLGLVQPWVTQAGNMSSIGSASPYLQQGAGLAGQAGQQNYLPLASQYINQGVASNPLAAAQPYLNAAAGPVSGQISDVMNPYITQVNDQLATQAQRNFEKFTNPAVNSQFISAGQAGSSRNADYGALAKAYALQDLESQQSQNLQQGFNTATQAALQKQAQLGQLGQTAGGLQGAQQQALMGAGTNLANIGYQGAQTQLGAAGQLGALGQTFGNLTTAQQQQLLNSGALLGSTNSSDIQQRLAAAQGLTQQGSAAGALTAQGAQQQLGAANQLGALSTQYQQGQLNQAQAQDALGQEQQGYGTQAIQANNQNILNQANWTPQQLQWLSGIIHGLPAQGQTINTTTQGPSSVYSPSPAAQLAGLATLGRYGT